MLDRKLFSSPAKKSVEPTASRPPVFPLPRLDGQPPVLLVLNHNDLAIDVAYERNHIPGSPLVRTSTRNSELYWIPRLTPVFAVSDGKVIDDREDANGAHRLILDHENSWFTIYGGLEHTFVRPRERIVQIRAGDPLGYLAEMRDGPLRTLRFELWRLSGQHDYEQIDPVRHMRCWQQIAWQDPPLPVRTEVQAA